MGACRFIQYNSKQRDSYKFSMLTMICLQTHILSKDEYAYNFFFKCRTADIYRMRHVIHMPHSIYVSVTRQTNTNKKNYTHQLHHFQCKYRIRYAFCIIGHVAEDDFVFLTPHQLMHIGRRIGFTISRLISFYCLWCSCSLETMASLGSARAAGC